MGTDIHICIEKYDKDKDLWEYVPYEDICDGRNYELFGFLSGVRGDTDIPLKIPNGTPTDLSSYVELIIRGKWCDYGHHYSYFGLSEIIEHERWNVESRLCFSIPYKDHVYYKKHGHLPSKYFKKISHKKDILDNINIYINSDRELRIRDDFKLINFKYLPNNAKNLYLINHKLSKEDILENISIFSRGEIAIILKYQKHLSRELRDSVSMLLALNDVYELPSPKLKIETDAKLPFKYKFYDFYFGFLKKLEKKFGLTDDVRIVLFYDN